MTVFEETGAAEGGARPAWLRVSTGLRPLARTLRRLRRRLDAHYRLSDFNERLIYDLGIEPIDLRSLRNTRRGDAFMRLRRMRSRRAARRWQLG